MDDAKPPFFNDLDASCVHAWRLLTRAVPDRRSGFHTPAISTIGLDGAPSVRTVVLRHVDEAARIIRFHTDTRAPKIAELTREPRIGALFYDFKSKLQLRANGVARIHAPGSALALECWERSQEMSRVCYAQTQAPRAVLSDPLEGEARGSGGVEHFSVVVIEVQKLEWLYLHHEGHRRALFEWRDGHCHKQWLAP